MSIMSPRQKEPLTYEHALLGFLIETPMHAYALHQQMIQTPLGQVWHIKQSALYAMITRLHDESYITVATDRDDARGKRYLTITASGQQVFSAWCRTPVSHPRDIRIEFLAKLYFTMRCYPTHASQLFVAQQHTCALWLHQLKAPHGTTQYARMVYAYRRGQIEAAIRWIDECQQLVAE
jgi:PadR family transcriptional regulator, regulatory protein AphA